MILSNKVLNTSDAAGYLGITESTLHGWRQTERHFDLLPHHKIGGRYYYHTDQLDTLKDSGRKLTLMKRKVRKEPELLDREPEAGHMTSQELFDEAIKEFETPEIPDTEPIITEKKYTLVIKRDDDVYIFNELINESYKPLIDRLLGSLFNDKVSWEFTEIKLDTDA